MGTGQDVGPWMCLAPGTRGQAGHACGELDTGSAVTPLWQGLMAQRSEMGS